jgi:VanZ family protein
MILNKTNMIYHGFSPRVRRIFGIAALVWAGAIIFQSLEPSNAQASIPHLDKIVHALAYFGLGCATLPALPRIAPGKIWLAITGMGGAIELAQRLMDLGRSGDVMDACANAAGALLAIMVWGVISRLRQPSAQITAK